MLSIHASILWKNPLDRPLDRQDYNKSVPGSKKSKNKATKPVQGLKILIRFLDHG